jgi:hypothetical protein
VPGTDSCSAANSVLINYFVSQQLHRYRYVDAERFGSLHVDHKLELGRLNDRKVGRLLTPENSAGENSSLAVRFPEFGSVAYQAAGGGEFAKLKHRRNRITSRQGGHLINAVGK